MEDLAKLSGFNGRFAGFNRRFSGFNGRKENICPKLTLAVAFGVLVAVPKAVPPCQPDLSTRGQLRQTPVLDPTAVFSG